MLLACVNVVPREEQGKAALTELFESLETDGTPQPIRGIYWSSVPRHRLLEIEAFTTERALARTSSADRFRLVMGGD